MAVAKKFREGRFQELRDHEWFGMKEKVEVDPKAHRLGGIALVCRSCIIG